MVLAQKRELHTAWVNNQRDVLAGRGKSLNILEPNNSRSMERKKRGRNSTKRGGEKQGGERTCQFHETSETVASLGDEEKSVREESRSSSVLENGVKNVVGKK